MFKNKKRTALLLAAALFFSSMTTAFAYDEETDQYDKSNTIMGIVYNELRTIEIEWASKLRAYGTSTDDFDYSLTVSADDDAALLFTEEYLTAEEYVNSAQGELDQLGATIDGIRYGWVTGTAEYKNGKTTEISGIIGPEPFEGASIAEYKILTDIDGGNTLEIRGKPQEGYTSNAKEIAAMTEVYFSQTMDAIQASVDAANGWKKIVLAGEMLWNSIGTWATNNHIFLLGALFNLTGSSYTQMARDYAYPLMQYSHTSYFYLSEYIYPTRWTVPDESLYAAGGGDADEMDAASRDADHVWDSSQSIPDGDDGEDLTLSEESNANVGIGTEGGTNKTTSDFESEHVSGGSATDEDGNENQSSDTSFGASEGYVEIEYCPEDEFGGFGCVQADVFAYKWTGSFASEKYSKSDGIEGLVITDSDAVQTLYYGYDYATDVSGEVSVFDSVIDKDHKDGLYDDYTTYDGKWNWQDGSCIVHPTALNETTVLCWEFDSVEELDSEDVVDLFGLTYSGSDDADNTSKTVPEWTWEECEWYESAVREYLTNTAVGTDYSDWMVAGFEETDDGFYIYLVENPLSYVTVEKSRTVDYEYDEYYEEYVYDEDGNILYDDDGNPITYTASRKATGTTTETWNEYYVDYENTGAVRILFNHACLGADGDDSTAGHTGTYCGGHLQLKIRGVVYGLTEDQMDVSLLEDTDGDGSTNDEIAFVPKFLDPSEWDESTYVKGDSSTYPTEDDVSESELEKYDGYELTVWNILDGIYDSDDENYDASSPTAYISAADYLDEDEGGTGAYKNAEDLFDIDILIHRALSSYPGYNGVLSAAISSDDSTLSSSSTYFWRSWTEANMTEVVSLVSGDWKDMYDLADTQTIVGGIYDSSSDYLNAISDTVQDNLLELLGYYDLPVETADISDPEAYGYYDLDGDGEYDVLTAYERERIDRLRHVVYALNCVGAVSYSQSAHSYYYGNIAGHLSDCSGFVSNIWRDRIGGSTTLTTSGLISLAVSLGCIYEYTGVGTEGIDTGDIIVQDASGSNAHALLYIGEFTEEELYGEGGSTEVQVYTVDCSSMVIAWSTMENYSDYPDTAAFGYTGTGTTASSYIESMASYQVEDDPVVYSGNVRFAARSTMQTDKGNHDDGDYYTGTWYIDMTALSDYMYSGTDDEGNAVSVEEGEPYIYDQYGEIASEITSDPDTGMPYATGYVSAGYVSEFLFDFDFLGDTCISYWLRVSTDTEQTTASRTIATSVAYESYDNWREYVESLESDSSSGSDDDDSNESNPSTGDHDSNASGTDVYISSTYKPSGSDYTEEELFIALIWGEAEGEGYIGQLAVAIVVLNRIRLSGYPNTLYGVMYQKSQFSCTTDGRVNKALSALSSGTLSSYDTIVQAMNDAIEMVNEYEDGDEEALRIEYNNHVYDFSAATNFNSLSGGGTGWVWIKNQRFYNIYQVS